MVGNVAAVCFIHLHVHVTHELFMVRLAFYVIRWTFWFRFLKGLYMFVQVLAATVQKVTKKKMLAMNLKEPTSVFFRV